MPKDVKLGPVAKDLISSIRALMEMPVDTTVAQKKVIEKAFRNMSYPEQAAVAKILRSSLREYSEEVSNG